MYQEEFLPVVFKMEISSDPACSVEKWHNVINELFCSYVDNISRNENRIIGHIKALAEIDKENYIKYSCISNSDHINHEVHCTQQNINKISIVVNSLVSNISEFESRQFFEKSCQAAKNSGIPIKIAIEENNKKGLESHHHHGDAAECPICKAHHQHRH